MESVRRGYAPSFSSHVLWCDPDFLHAASARFACAAFCKESRMKFAGPTKLDRKSGGTWGTRPEDLDPAGFLFGGWFGPGLVVQGVDDFAWLGITQNYPRL